jgi:hypothetical protein
MFATTFKTTAMMELLALKTLAIQRLDSVFIPSLLDASVVITLAANFKQHPTIFSRTARHPSSTQPLKLARLFQLSTTTTTPTAHHLHQLSAS